MASLLGLGGANAIHPIKYSHLNVSSSKMELPVPIFWGMRRLTTNAIWYNNFQKHSVSKGGKGGGKSGQYDYTAAVIVALCEGTVDLIQNIWAQASTTTTTTLSKLHMTFFNGTAVQAPWSYVTTNYPVQARAYALTSYLACPKMDLGQAATIPDNQFECQRLMSFAYTHTTPGYIHPTTLVQNNGIDVLLSDVIPDFLTNPQYGMGFSSGDLGDLAQFAAYQQAQGLFFSPLIDQQDKATSILDRWAQLANSWIYWSGTQLLFYPLGDAAITGNGATYAPTIDVSYALGPGDFVGDAPVKVSRVDPADAYNRTRLDICDRTLGYISNPIEYKDQTLVDAFGLRDNAGVDGKDVCDPIVGKIVVQLIGKRAAYIRNTYAFKATYRLVRCLPGTVLTLTEPNMGLNQVRVRVRTITEGADGTLDFVCEEFPGTIATYAASDPGAGNVATTPNSYADPGLVNTPCIVEPSSAFTGGVAKLLITASGGASWGGAQVNLSFDGMTYTPIGNIIASVPQGVLTASLASHADPDTVDTLAVNCAQSLTVPQPVTNADADALRTLSMVCAQPTLVGGAYVMPSNGELLAFGDVATTGTYAANLTYLRRGQYGTAPSAHAIGDQFTVIDVLGSSGTTVSYDLPARYVGVPLYVKFCSTNSFGLASEDISTVAEYQYTPIGTGFGGGTGGIPTVPTGLTATPGNGQNQIAWAANPSTDGVTTYTLYTAPGLGASFGSATAIFTGSATAFTHSGLGNSAPYTYFVVATNVVGSSTHTAGVSTTTNAAGMGTVSSVGSGTGLTGGPITGSGTLSLAAITDGDVLANTSGSSAAPVPTTLSAFLDHVLGSTRGSVIYRGASAWNELTPGTSGYVLTCNGSAADPTWSAAAGGSLLLGSGAPSAYDPAGTVYSRTDAAGLYVSTPTTTSGSATVVQSAQKTSTFAVPNVVLGSTPTLGNLLIAIVQQVASPSGGFINGWTSFKTQSTTNLLYRYVQSGDTVTLPNFDADAGYITYAMVVEITGVSGTWATDFDAVSATSNALPTGAFSTSANNELVLLASSSGGGFGSYTHATGWTNDLSNPTPSETLDHKTYASSGSAVSATPSWSVGTTANGNWFVIGIKGTASPVAGWTSVSGLSAIADGDLLANTSGGSAVPVATSLSALIDYAFGSTRGSVLYRGASGWADLSPGTNTYVLTSNGAGADPSWQVAPGAGGAGTTPTIVQSRADTGGTASITLGAAPTNGNLLVAMCFNPTVSSAGSGWTLQTNNGSGTDYGLILTKVAGAGESATQSPLGSSPGGTGAIMMWELNGQAGSNYFVAGASQSEQTTQLNQGPALPNIVNMITLHAIGVVTSATISAAYNATQDQLVNSGNRRVYGGHAFAPGLGQLLATLSGAGNSKICSCLITH